MADPAAPPAAPPAAHPAAAAPVKAPTRPAAGAKPKFTFMLHHPDMTCAGRYVSDTHRHAALKAASKGVTQILLRRTNSKEVWEFRGATQELPEPKQIRRGDKVVAYSRKPTVEFLRSWVYEQQPAENK